MVQMQRQTSNNNTIRAKLNYPIYDCIVIYDMPYAERIYTLLTSFL